MMAIDGNRNARENPLMSGRAIRGAKGPKKKKRQVEAMPTLDNEE